MKRRGLITAFPPPIDPGGLPPVVPLCPHAGEAAGFPFVWNEDDFS